MTVVFSKQNELKEIIKRHEGFVSRAYQCPAGKWTIGYGRNIEDVGITEQEADMLLDNDLLRIFNDASKNWDWFDSLDRKRRYAVACMIYQMGFNGFSKFKKTIAHIAAGEFAIAADEAMNSAWAKQTPARAREVTDMLRNG